MELKNLNDTCAALEALAAELIRQAPADVELDGLPELVPERPGDSEEQLQALEHELGQRLPTSTRAVLSFCQLGGIGLAGVWFSETDTLVGFLRQQLENPKWEWAPFEPVKGTLMLGFSTGWLIITSLSTGEVLAAPIDWPDEGWLVVAASLDLFVRALGHLVVNEKTDDPEGHAAELARCVHAPNAEQFWFQATMGSL